jgi:hypothetical protein
MPPAQQLSLTFGKVFIQDDIAVAYVAQDHGAEVTALGTLGTRQCDIDQGICKMPSKATYLIFVDEAGPCGPWPA